MTLTPQTHPPGSDARGLESSTNSSEPSNDEEQDHRWLRRLALLLLVLLGSFCCMLLAAQIALLRMGIDPLERDVRSVVEVNYGAGERRAAPLIPQVIEDIKDELESPRPTRGAGVTPEPVVRIPPPTPTAVALVTPTPTDTPRPSDTPVPTISVTPSPAPPADTPVPTPTATSPPPPTVTPTPPPPPTATFTPLPPPTITFTPSPEPTHTFTPPPPPPTNTFTPTPTSTPTATATDTPTPTPTDTPTPTNTPVPPPVVLGITPAATVQGSGIDPPFDVTIIGQDFLAPVTAWLGELSQNILISVSNATSTVITGTLSPNIPVGVYALTVQNMDGQQGFLSPAFTVYPRPHPATTFESAAAFVATFGSAAAPEEGDDDYVQIIFFEMPDGPADALYIRVFDADTGGANDEPGVTPLTGDTVMTYTVRGGGGAYTTGDARSDHPSTVGINSGALLAQRVIGMDGTLDDQWLTLPITRTQGDLVGSRRVFKLAVQGASGDDGNVYHVAISSSAIDNVAVAGARVFAFSWCIMLPNQGDQVSVYPYVPSGTSIVTQYNFDLDAFGIGTAITLTTPLRNLPVVGLSLDGPPPASEGFPTLLSEVATSWTALYVTGTFPSNANDFVLWIHGDGVPLAVFTAPTLFPPP